MKPFIRFLSAALLAAFLLPAALSRPGFGQQDNSTCNNGKTCSSRSATITVSGGTPVTIPNIVGGLSASFEELISGSPATVSIVIQGCKQGGTCTTLETNTSTTAGQIRSPTISTVYDYFTVAASWTGGTNPTVSVNSTLTTARNGSGGGAPTGAAGGSLAGTYPNPSIANAAAVTALFAGCSGTQYLGFDGNCHAAGVGTVTSVDGSGSQGAETVVAGSVAALTGAGTVRAALPWLVKTGAYSFADADRGHAFLSNDASNDVYTLPTPSGSNFQNGWYAYVKNGSTTNTIALTPAGATTVDGQAVLTIPTHIVMMIESDGTNYHSIMVSPVGNNAANLVFASPNGASGVPNLRALVAADVPALPESGITSLVSDLALKAPASRSLATTTPLGGGGDLSADRTLTCVTCLVASSPAAGILHVAGATQTVTSSAVDLSGVDATGTLAAARMPALTGDCTTSAGAVSVSCGSVIARTGVDINSSNQVTATHLAAALPVAQGGSGTASPALVAGSNVTITGSWPNQTINSSAPGTGTVTSFSAGTLSPIFTTSVATATTTPALSFTLSTAGAHAFLGNNTGSTAAPAYVQPAFTDISGSVAAAQLPNPSASTLGGIQSAAAVSNQWINSISTSGVPALSQPGFSNLSGSVAAGQMPALTGDCTTSAGAVSVTCGSAIARTGTDVNTSNQVTATHLAAALPVNQGGTGTTSTLTGLIRGNSSAMTAAELSADASTNGSNAVTVKQAHWNETAITNASSPYSVVSSDAVISCDASSGVVTINLPAATGTGRYLTIKKTDSSANACTPTRAGSDLIDGVASYSMTVQYAASSIVDTASAVWSRTHVNQLGGDLSGVSTNAVVAAVNGVTYPSGPAAHSVPVVTTANTTATYKAVPDCTDASGNHLNYTQSTDAFSCGSSSAAPALSAVTAATGSHTIANGNNPQIWNFAQTTDSQAAVNLGETSAATGGTITGNVANQSGLKLSTATNSTASPLLIAQGSITNTVATPAIEITVTYNNSGLNAAGLLMSATNTSCGTCKLVRLLAGSGGTTEEFYSDALGNTFSLNSFQGPAYKASGNGAATFTSGNTGAFAGGTVGLATFGGGSNSSASNTSGAGAGLFQGGDETGATGTTTAGAGTLRGGDSNSSNTGTQAGNLTIRPGRASAVASATDKNGKLILLQTFFTSGTATVGSLACVTASLTVATCSSAANNARYIGIIVSVTSNTADVQTSGTVNALALSAAFTAGDYACADTTTTAGDVVDSSTPCTAGLGVGMVLQTATTTSPEIVLRPF